LYKKPVAEAAAAININHEDANPLSSPPMTPDRAKEIVLRYFSESTPGFKANSGTIGHMLAKQGFDAKKLSLGSLSHFLRTACGLTVEPGPNGKVWVENAAIETDAAASEGSPQ
jgi:hypothetical protein